MNKIKNLDRNITTHNSKHRIESRKMNMKKCNNNTINRCICNNSKSIGKNIIVLEIEKYLLYLWTSEAGFSFHFTHWRITKAKKTTAAQKNCLHLTFFFYNRIEAWHIFLMSNLLFLLSGSHTVPHNVTGSATETMTNYISLEGTRPAQPVISTLQSWGWER